MVSSQLNLFKFQMHQITLIVSTRLYINIHKAKNNQIKHYIDCFTSMRQYDYNHLSCSQHFKVYSKI